jgi:hypothetical protein
VSSTIYKTATNTSNITAISISDSHVAPAANAMVVAESTTLGVGDSISIDMGYTDDHQVLFNGYVKSIEVKEPELLYTITAANVMTRAIDFFIVSNTPDSAYKRDHIAAEELIRQLLAMAGLTSYGFDATSFTFGINTVVEVNLTSAYDYCRFIAGILAYTIYADKDGKSWFVNRRPYPMPGDVSVATITGPSILEINYSRSDRDLRNKVVVYGSEGIYSTAQAASPYVPAGLYRSIAVSAPGVIDTQTMADQSAAYNLELLNRLTEQVSLVIIGNPNIAVRDVVTITRPSIGVAGNWYVYSLEQASSKTGYVTSMELRR